jgi:hypothetical protein
MAATYEELMLKARELAAQGDEESARRVAQIALQRRDSTPQETPANTLRGSVTQFGERAGVPAGQEPAPNLASGMAGSALQGGLLGLGDEYLAGLSSVLGVQPDGQGGANWFDYSKPIGERYATARDQIRKEQGAFEEQRPAVALGTEFLGAMAVPGAAMKPGAGMAVNAMRGAATGGAMGAGYGFGTGEGAQDRLEGAANQGILGTAVGGAAGAVLPKVLERATSRAQRKALEEAGSQVDLEEMASGANRLYDKVDEAGVRIRPQALREGVDRITAGMVDQGLDQGSSALNLTPKGARVAQLLDETVPADMVDSMPSVAFRDVERLRRKAGIAAGATDRADRNVGMAAINGIDDFIDNLDESQLLGGDPEQLRSTIKAAREGWQQLSKSRTIQEIIENAKGYKSGFESGLKNGFANILRNPKRRRGFSEAEIEAMREVVDGTTAGRLMSQIGRLGVCQ